MSIVPGEQWKRLRSIIAPTFATGKLRQMQPRIDLALETLMKNIQAEVDAKNGENIDMKELFGGFTMNSIIQVAYGIRVDSLNEGHPIIKHVKEFFGGFNLNNLFAFFVMLTVPKLANMLKIRINGAATDFFRDFSTEIIEKRKKDLAEMKAKGEAFKPNNFLDFMIEAEHENENESNEEEKKNKCKFHGGRGLF